MRKILCLLAVLLLGQCAYAGTDTTRGMQRAAQLYEKEKFAAAISLLDKLIEEAPDNAGYYYIRALSKMRREDNDAAIADLNSAYYHDSKSIGVLMMRAYLYEQQQQTKEARQDYFKALKLVDERNTEMQETVLSMLGNVMVSERDFKGAMKIYRRMLDLDSNSLSGINGFLRCTDELGDHEGAIKITRNAIRRFPDEQLFQANLGWLLASNGYYREAIEANTAAIAMDSEASAYPYSNRGLSKCKLGDLEGAMTDLNTSIGMDPTNSYAFKNRAVIYIAMKQNDKACKDLRHALEIGYTKKYGSEAQDLLTQLRCE